LAAERERLLSQLAEACERFLALARDVPEGRMTEEALDRWSVRDVAAHFAGLHRQMADAFQRTAAGENPSSPDAADLSEDEYNAMLVAAASELSALDVLADLPVALEECASAARLLPDEMFSRGKACRRWLAEEAEHYENHMRAIRHWMDRF
jgi:hypothetical protein